MRYSHDAYLPVVVTIRKFCGACGAPLSGPGGTCPACSPSGGDTGEKAGWPGAPSPGPGSSLSEPEAAGSFRPVHPEKPSRGSPNPGSNGALSPDPGPKDPGVFFDWVYEIPIVNNLLMVRDLCIAFGIGLLVVAALILYVSEAWAAWGDFLEFMKLVMILVGILVALFLVSAALLGNSIPTRFFLIAEGVGYEAASDKDRTVSTLAVLVGALARSPGTMGAGLIAASQESDFCQWGMVKKVTVYRGQRAIDIRYSILKPIRLYCTSENFQPVWDCIREQAPSATFRVR